MKTLDKARMPYLLRCTKCDARILTLDAHEQTEDRMILAIRKANPHDPLWVPEFGPYQLYHTVLGAWSQYKNRREEHDCGPLRDENEGDAYIDWALANGKVRRPCSR